MTNESALAPTIKFKMPGWSLRSPEHLREMLHQIKSPAFERGFRQNPNATADLVFGNFKKGRSYYYGFDWRLVSDENTSQFNEDSPLYVDPTWPTFTGCDLAGKKRRGTVIFTIAVSPVGAIHVLDIQILMCSASEFADELEKVYKKFLPTWIFVENNALQEAYIEIIEIKKKSCFRVVKGYHTGAKKTDPLVGLPSLNAQYEMGQWRLAIPHREEVVAVADATNPGLCGCERCMFVRAVENFTYEDYDSTPDVIMAQFFAKEAARLAMQSGDHAIGIVRQSSSQIVDHAIKHPNYLPSVGPLADRGRLKNTKSDFGRQGTMASRKYICSGCNSCFAMRRGEDLPKQLNQFCPRCKSDREFF